MSNKNKNTYRIALIDNLVEKIGKKGKIESYKINIMNNNNNLSNKFILSKNVFAWGLVCSVNIVHQS